jgi:hypothetical protein
MHFTYGVSGKTAEMAVKDLHGFVIFLLIIDPKMFTGLSGWVINSMSAGNTSLFALGDSSTTSWGQGCNSGELGHGANKPRSATNAVLVDALEGFETMDVSCGLGQTLLIVNKSIMNHLFR